MSYPPTASLVHDPAMPRYTTVHSNSSAFSASAGPNEDWTKISDLAERRRIQNRIAQRNYRKKLKRRLEDLERRAGSTSLSPEPELQQHHAASMPAARPRAHTLAVLPTARKRRTSSNAFQHHAFASSCDDSTEYTFQAKNQSSAPCPIFPQQSFNSSADLSYAPSYSFSSSYTSPSTTTVETACYNTYLQPPSMRVIAANEAVGINHEPNEDELSSFSFGYFPGGYDFTKADPYRDVMSNTPFTPPFSDFSESFADSVSNSSMGSPPTSMSALYPTPPASVIDDDPPIFSIPIDLALDELDFFRML